MKVLFKEPIKQAVRETLAEEGPVSGDASEQSWREGTDRRLGILESARSPKRTSQQSTDGSSSVPGPKLVVPAVILLGAAIALRRRSGGGLETGKLEEMIGQDDTSMEEDMSKSTPTDSENSQFSDDRTGEVDV